MFNLVLVGVLASFSILSMERKAEVIRLFGFALNRIRMTISCHEIVVICDLVKGETRLNNS